MPDSYLFLDSRTPSHARFPVIDAHNHLWSDWAAVERTVAVMDEVGVVTYADLTANLSAAQATGGHDVHHGSLDDFLRHTAEHYPGRFFGFTTATLAPPRNQPLFTNAARFVAGTLDTLRDHVAKGARGLKVRKELGLHYRDDRGDLVRLDDKRLAPIWEEAGRLNVPVLMHQSDPCGFFEPVMPANEHYDTLLKYPSWSFCDPAFPRKRELLERRDRVLANHPGTTFLLPHVANFPENLGYVATLLDRYPNVSIDCAGRCDELGRQPYSARRFLIDYQDRVCFGTDMPASVDMYRFHFRFLETWDEFFIPPDYDGTFGRHRWRVHGLGLPDDVLRKIYFENALRLIPALRQDAALSALLKRWVGPMIYG